MNEAELAALLARLKTLENNFHEAVEAEKLEAMAEFAAGAGHEINNPLTIIAGRAQLFLQGETDPERRRALALVNSQAMRIYEMIADMMLFARPSQPNFALVDAAKIIDETLPPTFKRPPRGRKPFLSRLGHPGPLEIEADAVQLTVAIRALCQNSLEALGHGGHVEIDLKADGGEVTIRRDRQRAGHNARTTPPYLRPLLFRPAGRPRPGHGTFKMLADRDQPRRPGRGGKPAGARGEVCHYLATTARVKFSEVY